MTRWRHLMAQWNKAHERYVAAVEKLRVPTADAQEAEIFEKEANARRDELTKIKAEIDEIIRGAFKNRAPIIDSLIVTNIETRPLTSGESEAPPQEKGKVARGAKRGQ